MVSNDMSVKLHGVVRDMRAMLRAFVNAVLLFDDRYCC